MKAEDCGMLKQGTSIVIDGYAARVEKDFNLYEAAGGFVAPVEPDKEAFFNYLEESGLIVNIVLETEEYETVSANGYYLMSQLPKLEDWQLVAAMLGEESEWPMVRVHYTACSLDKPIHVNLNTGDVVSTTLREMFSDIPSSEYGKKELLEWLNSVQGYVAMEDFKKKMADQKEKHGVLVMNVFDNKTGRNLSYTDGLVDTLGFEIFAEMVNLPLHVLGHCVKSAYTRLQAEDVEAIAFKDLVHLEDFKVADENMRCKLVEVKPTNCPVGVNKKPRVLQLLLPDAGNLLPDEEGYNFLAYPQLTVEAL
jgi:hypothetical protein